MNIRQIVGRFFYQCRVKREPYALLHADAQTQEELMVRSMTQQIAQFVMQHHQIDKLPIRQCFDTEDIIMGVYILTPEEMDRAMLEVYEAGLRVGLKRLENMFYPGNKTNSN